MEKVLLHRYGTNNLMILQMKTWAESKQMPGQFTGSTGAKVLTPAELSSGYQAWARKVKFIIVHFILPTNMFLYQNPVIRCIFKSNIIH